MKGPIRLPPIKISATPPNKSAGHKVDFGAPPLTPPALRAIANHIRLRAYLKGEWQATVNNLLIEATRNNPHFIGPIKDDLAAAHSADQFMCLNPLATAESAWRQGWSQARSKGTIVDKNESELSGGIFSPMKALAHAISGEGSPLNVKIQNLGIRPNLANLPALRTIIDNAQIGSSPINIEKVAYNTGIDSRVTEAYLGNITLKISGHVHKYDQHHFTFTGEARAYHDIYDANPSTHRSWLAETATTVLSAIMQNENSKSYEISISGSVPINHSQ